VLFIVAGAFAGLEEIISQRVGRHGIGFGAPLHSKNASEDLFSQVLPEDLHKFGLIPEFIGRLPVVTTVTPLDKTALIDILTTPKNALIKQYQRMFVLDGVALEFEQEALEEIAALAEVRQTGARGLRAILGRGSGGLSCLMCPRLKRWNGSSSRRTPPKKDRSHGRHKNCSASRKIRLVFTLTPLRHYRGSQPGGFLAR